MSSTWFCHQNEPPSIDPAVSVPSTKTLLVKVAIAPKVAIPALTISPPVFILTPDLAVTRPTASTFVTSSYDRTPCIFTFPVNVDAAATILPTFIFGVPVRPPAVPDVF